MLNGPASGPRSLQLAGIEPLTLDDVVRPLSPSLLSPPPPPQPALTRTRSHTSAASEPISPASLLFRDIERSSIAHLGDGEGAHALPPPPPPQALARCLSSPELEIPLPSETARNAHPAVPAARSAIPGAPG
ncbi:hypothetical protein H9P43_005523 [Blastocladiella emersonii ATCC 22665]|nr:hypothetical protein H9P43_005523 [Blastocladiella emersonii ATCC 22665]